MRKPNRKSLWTLIGALMLALSVLIAACGIIEPAAPPPPVATIAPPVIPHSIEGRADCRLCHAAGVGGAPQFPANHSERPSDVCLTCHVTATSVAPSAMPMPPAAATPPPTSTAPATISAKELYSTKCAACHGVNREGVAGFAPALTPQSLSARSDTEIRNAILDGRPGTAMPPFKATLSPEEIDALLQFIKSAIP